MNNISIKKYLLDDLINNANIEMRAGNFIAALQLLAIAIKIFPRNGICYFGAAMACMEIDEQEQAELLCELASRFAEDENMALIIKGEIEQRRKNFLAALTIWSLLRENFPLCPEGYERAADVWAELGKPDHGMILLESRFEKQRRMRSITQMLVTDNSGSEVMQPKKLALLGNIGTTSRIVSECGVKHHYPRAQNRPDLQFLPAQNLFTAACKIYASNIIDWKRELLNKLFPLSNICYLDEINHIDMHVAEIMQLSSQGKNVFFLTWSMSNCKDVIYTARKFSIPLIRVEDGFIRSVGAGIKRVPPYSLCFDSHAMHFDCWHASDLENLIIHFDANTNTHLLSRANECIKFIINERITKYNVDVKTDMNKIYGPKNRKRILVIGQVEDDKSIKFGCGPVRTNRALLEIAIKENPNAQIIFKNHPDLNFGRIIANSSSIKDLEDNFLLLESSTIGIDDALEGVDNVYTMTSLSGFEALLRGVKVSVFGSPFYAGWGLTDDRLFNKRRQKKRSLEEVFACAYMLYPVYFIPEIGNLVTLEEVLNLIKKEKSLIS